MYQYQELPTEGDYTRRLILEPGEGDAPLVGRLEPIELSRAHDLYPFKAISYVWGVRIENQTITVDGKCLEITKSLRDSLRQTRDAYEPVALWADAICINQNDDKEKNRQVALMGRIYEASQRALICLGIDPEHRQCASDVAGFIAEAEILIDEVFQDPNFSWDWNSFPWPFDDDPVLTDPRWESLFQLGAQPWFERGWVVQEAALGPDPLVLWAGEEIRLTSFLRVHVWLSSRVYPLNPALDSSGPSNILFRSYNNQHPEEVRTFYTEETLDPTEALHPLEILNLARFLKVTDPKDRIYAFMGLREFNRAMLTVQPNYGKDVSHLDVYKDFAIKYLETTLDLNILNCVFHEEGDIIHSLPSWVPRWDCDGDSIAGVFGKTERKITRNENEHDNSRDFSILTVDGSPALRVRAIILDSVKWASELITYANAEEAHEAVTQVVSLWRSLAPQLERNIGPHSSDPSFAFLVTLSCGFYLGDWDKYYQNLHEFARRLQSDQPSHPADAYAHDPVTQKVALSLDDSRDQKFVLLGRGYYGLGPNITLEGDVCAIIFGTSLPFILRRVPGKGDQYRVVGPGFVLSKKVRPWNGAPLRLAEDKSCEDWKDWNLPTEDITLV